LETLSGIGGEFNTSVRNKYVNDRPIRSNEQKMRRRYITEE